MRGPSTITGSTVSVAAITAVGTTATSGGYAGGNGGAILLDATAGGITLGGNLTTTGGNGNGAGLGGNAGNITVSDAATLTANRHPLGRRRHRRHGRARRQPAAAGDGGYGNAAGTAP